MKKIAMYWGASCGGCDVSFLGLHEKILDLLNEIEIVFWPCATDFKYGDLEKMEDGDIDVAFYNGAIRTSENEEIARLIRRKSKILVAYGSCAVEGCIIGLANLYERKEIFDSVYSENDTTVDKRVPSKEIPEFLPYLKTLDEVVKVDAFIPGCPPPAPVLEEALDALLSGETEFGGGTGLCDECPRRDTKPDGIKIDEVKRWHTIKDDGKCFIAQGIICMGLATRAGCGAECIKANIPCTGCMGGVEGLSGVSMISSIASLIDGEDEEKESEVVEGIYDIIGTFFKYSAAKLLPYGRLKDES